MSDGERPKWLTVQDITRHLQVHEETVRRWIRDGELRAVLLGSTRGGYRIKPEDLDAFLEAQAHKGKAARLAA